MKEVPFVKPAVLRDLPSPSQPRTLALPRHRHAAEPVGAVAKAAQTLTGWNGGARPVSAIPSLAPLAPPASPSGPSVDEIRASVLAEDRQRAHEEGLREGLQEAQARVEAAIRQQAEQWQTRADAQWAAQTETLRTAREAEIARLSRVVQDLDAAVAARLAALEDDAVDLAFAAVCRLIGERAATRETVADGVRLAIAQLSGAALHRVRLHPDDLALLADDPLRAAHASVEWVADPAVTPGGCLLDGAQGTLDTRLDRQLDRLRQVWLGAVDHARQAR
ncbi:hypothetical protein CDL60_12930 [Roseateles noduli]|nr:hypothetical protein CDL60_12930 [Roseateles noduli]